MRNHLTVWSNSCSFALLRINSRYAPEFAAFGFYLSRGPLAGNHSFIPAFIKINNVQAMAELEKGSKFGGFDHDLRMYPLENT